MPVQIKRDERTDESLVTDQPCYGEMFAADDPECRHNCAARDLCMDRTLRATIPERMGLKQVPNVPASYTAQRIALVLDSTEQTAQALVDLRRGKTPDLALGITTPEDDDTAADIDAVVDMVSTMQAQPPAIPEHPEPAPKETAMKKPEKKKAAAKVAKKPAAKKAAPKKTPAPKKAKVKTAKAIKGEADEASLGAWTRERARSAWVRGLPPGAAFEREFHGKVYTLKVDLTDRRYLLNGKPFPTVYAATAAVVGKAESATADGGTRTMPAWSSQRFWAPKSKAKGKAAGKKAAPVKKAKGKAVKVKPVKAPQVPEAPKAPALPPPITKPSAVPELALAG
jgi:hypothetical protein